MRARVGTVGIGAALLIASGLGLVSASDVGAQEWGWPERGENLQVLPADFPPERLSAVMRGFTNALGVRCTYCHVGEDGRPLSTYDFASDANPNKDRARAMYRLLGVVNEELAGFEPSGERVNVWCHTCHAGKPRPQTLDEAILERYRAEGPVAAVAHYRDLRARYYGAAAYDLTPASVAELAVTLLQVGDTVTSRTFFELNLEDHPDSWEAHEGMGDILRVTGDAAGAAAHYRRALALSPENVRVTMKLERVRS